MDEKIRLDQFLKLSQLVNSGGEAKHFIQSGAVEVNGETEVRRSRKLLVGDVVHFEGHELLVDMATDDDKPQ